MPSNWSGIIHSSSCIMASKEKQKIRYILLSNQTAIKCRCTHAVPCFSYAVYRTLTTIGNIDVPSLPDSVSQEVGTNLHELRMEMTENDSDGSSIEESCTLQGCPAYINVLYGSRNPETT